MCRVSASGSILGGAVRRGKARPGLVNVDQGQVQLGGTLFAVLLAELVFLPLELDQLLMRGLEQVVAPGCILMRIFRHDEGSPLLRFTPDQGLGPQKVRYRKIAES